MINITSITRQSLGKVVSYYADGADDYYAKDGSAMQWQGAGAEALALEGVVEQARFRELLDGQIDSDTRLKRGSKSGAYKERLGLDLTFSAPKGVSLQALVHGDARIIEAHDRAVAAAVREAEKLASARVTENKKTAIERTGKLVVAKFRHETSRALDPDLHTHAFVLNMTQRRDGQWRALTNDALFKSELHLGNVYKASLAKELEQAGFLLRYERNGTFDLAHFTDEQIREFSQRSQQIEAALAAQGLDRSTATQAEKNQIALATRSKKEADVDRETVRREWKQRAQDLGIDFDSRDWKGAGANEDSGRTRHATQQIEHPVEWHAQRTIDFAIKSLTERQSIVDEKSLTEVALKHGMGVIDVDNIRAAIESKVASGHLIREEQLYSSVTEAQKLKKGRGVEPARLTKAEWVRKLTTGGRPRKEALKIVEHGIATGRLAPAEARYTTHIAQKREREILMLEREGRGKSTATVSKDAVDAFLAATPTIRDEQAKALIGMTQSTNRFSGVQGFAGVGKSFVTKPAKELLEAEGFRVIALAPYGSQVKSLQQDGIEARTLASFLKATDKKIDDKTVVFIDESGVIPTRQMLETMKLIEAHGARAVFIGDTAQTKAIEAGIPFAQLQKAGMEMSHLKEIQRQKEPELLKAVQLAAEGLSAKSVAHVSNIHSIKEPADRYRELVSAYVAKSVDEREKTLVITGTNASRKELNAEIRQALGLSGTGKRVKLLDRQDTTQAQRRHSKYYEIGTIIVPDIDYKVGLKRGMTYQVLDNGPGNKLTVKSPDGEVFSFSPARTTKLSVYKVETQELAPGDLVRVTHNDARQDLANGDRFKVAEVQEAGRIVLEDAAGNQRTLEGRAAQFLALAYTSTAHSAQGLTCDHVMMNVDTKSRTTTQEVWYVGISRARYEASVYTDDSTKLADAVNTINGKAAALEIKQLQHHGHEHPNREAGKKDIAYDDRALEHARNEPQKRERTRKSPEKDGPGVER